jgi:hypothetical protein
MPLARFLLAALTAALLAAVSATSAHAAFETVHASGLAVEPGGRAHFLSQTFESPTTLLIVHRQEPDGTLDGGVLVTGRTELGYLHTGLIAVDSAGTETIVWLDGPLNGPKQLRGRRRTADGRFGPIVIIGQDVVGFHQEIDLALDADGDAVLVWRQDVNGRPVVRGRRWLADGTLEAPVAFSSAYYPAHTPQVAVDPAGNAVVVWQRRGPGAVLVRGLSAQGELSAVRTVSASGDGTALPRVGVADDGTAVVTWDGKLRTRTAAGDLTPTVVLDPDGASPQDVAVAPNGDAVIVHAARDGDTGQDEVWIRARSAGGTLAPAQLLERLPARAAVWAPLRVDLDPAGNAVAMWNAGDDVRTRRRLAGGALTVAGYVAEGGRPGNALDVDAAGTATFLFGTQTRRRFAPSGTFGRVRALTFD